MIKKSFTLRVLLLSFLFLALPILIGTCFFFRNAYREAVKEAKKVLKSEATFRAYTITALKPVSQIVLRELDYILDVGKTLEDPERLHLLNQKLQERGEKEDFYTFIVKKEEPDRYRIVAASGGEAGLRSFLSQPPFLASIEQGEGTFIHYIFAPDNKHYTPYTYIVRAVLSPSTERVIGAIVIAADITAEVGTLLRSSSTSQQLHFAMLDNQDRVLDATDEALRGRIIPFTTQHIIASAHQSYLPIKPQDSLPFFTFMYEGEEQIAYCSFLTAHGISVISYAPKQAFFRPTLHHFLLLTSIYSFIMLVGSAITYWLSSWVSRPLRQLREVMTQVSKGNVSTAFQKEPLGCEINILGDMFNHTLETLLKNMQQAEDEKVKKETYQKEVSIGRRVQQSLLPDHQPDVKGIECTGLYVPAQEVGGDFYWYSTKQTQSGEEVLVITVVDAADRGVPACLYSLSLRSIFKSYATVKDDIGDIVHLSNRAFLQDAGEIGMCMTVFYAMFHTHTKQFCYCSCGHVPLFIKRASGEILTLSPSGMGLEERFYQPEKILLTSGDIGLLYNKGLVEVKNAAGETFSLERIKKHLRSSSWSTAKEMIDALHTQILQFVGSHPLAEEIIIVAFKVS